MTTTLYIADPATPSVNLFDLADPTGLNNLGGVKTKLVGIDAGAYTPEMGLFAPDTGDGSFRTKRRAPSVDMTIQLRTQATSQDTHRQALNRMFALLEQPRVLVYQGEGMAEAVHIFTLGASVDQLLRGSQQNWDVIVRQFQDVQLDLVIQRQPIILLGTELRSSVNVLTNAILIHDQDGTNAAVTGRPDGWTWRDTAGAATATNISLESTGGTNDGYGASLATVVIRELCQESAAVVAQVWSAQFVVGSAVAGLTLRPVIYFLNGASAIIATALGATLAGPVTKETRLTVTSAAAPAGTAFVRIGLRVDSTTAPAKAFILRRAQLELAPTPSRFRTGNVPVSNDPAILTVGQRGRHFYFWNDGEVSVPVKTIATMDAGATVQASIIGKRSQFGVTGLRQMGDLEETRYAQPEWALASPATTSERGWTGQFYPDTTNAGGGPLGDSSGAIPGGGATKNFLTTNHAQLQVLSVRRFRLTRTTKLDSLRGRFNVYVRVRGTGQPRQWGLQLHWGPSAVEDVCSELNDEVLFDTWTLAGDVSVPPLPIVWTEINVGSIVLPLDPNVPISGLALEMWSSIVYPLPIDRPVGFTAPLDWDLMWLVPADASGNEDSIGTMFLTGKSRAKTVGADLLSPPNVVQLIAPGTVDPVWVNGTDHGKSRRLNNTNEAAAYGPVGGENFGVGHHKVSFYVDDTLSGAHSTTFRITNVTDNNELDPATGDSTAAIFNGANNQIPSPVIIEWDVLVAGKFFQPMVGITKYGGNPPGAAVPSGSKGRLDILRVVYQFTPTVSSTNKLASDPGERYVTERLDSAEAFVASVSGTGEIPFTADRGLNFISVRHDEFAQKYFLDRQNKIARMPTMETRYRPGFYQL